MFVYETLPNRKTQMQEKLKNSPGDTQKSAFDTGGKKAHYIFTVCFLLYMVNFMDRQVLSVVMEPMKQDLGLSDTAVGGLQTAFLISIAFFAIPTAAIVDKWSRKKAVGLMAITWSFFTLMTGMGKSFAGLLTARMGVGVGEAGFTAGGAAMITAAYPKEKRGKMMGLLNIAIPLGLGLGVMLGGQISAYYGDWRMPFYIFAIPGFILGILAFFMRDYKTVKGDVEGGKVKVFFINASRLVKIPSLRWVYIGYGFHNFMSLAVLVWIPAFLMRVQNISEGKAGMIMGIIVVSSAVGAPLGGWLSDVWQKKNDRGRMLVPAVADILAVIAIITSLHYDIKGLGFCHGVRCDADLW